MAVCHESYFSTIALATIAIIHEKHVVIYNELYIPVAVELIHAHAGLHGAWLAISIATSGT